MEEFNLKFNTLLDSELGKNLLLWVAIENDTIIDSVQLKICTKPNGLHRAEVQKLLVHSKYRGCGIATRVMQVLEDYAKQNQISLLLLDTQTGSIAEKFYLNQGWHIVGEIPDYTKSNDGTYSATTYFYKNI